MEFSESLRLARAAAGIRAVGTVQKVIAGGYVLAEEPVLDTDGHPVYDENGELAWRRTYAKPDGRLALEYLARTAPDLGPQLRRTKGSELEQLEQLDDNADEDQTLSGLTPAETATVVSIVGRSHEYTARHQDQLPSGEAGTE